MVRLRGGRCGVFPSLLLLTVVVDDDEADFFLLREVETVVELLLLLPDDDDGRAIAFVVTRQILRLALVWYVGDGRYVGPLQKNGSSSQIL